MKNAEEYAERIESGTRTFVNDVRTASADKGWYRSSTDRYIGGVCGGVGERLGIDPSLLRLAIIVAALAGSSGIWIYVLLWIFLPSEATVAGELDAKIDDLPPMPRSGPYVDVPGVDPMPKKHPSRQPSTPDQTESTDQPASEPTSAPPVDDATFPKPDTTL
ncbi:PspC domain-containing protein [Stomatohabitans albus]|uniref:PspC domain-containing protein n=1 Tax=Stomatohabitans albus TaxID=3110766 RepID=UPI00300D7A22